MPPLIILEHVGMTVDVQFIRQTDYGECLIPIQDKD